MSGIGIIANPHSKLNKRNPGRAQLLSYIAGTKGRMETTNSLDDLKAVAQNFMDNEIEILAINGGDGTISQTLSTFIQVYGDRPLPAIALLKGGTINVVASNLKIKGSPEEVLYRLMEAHSTGRYKRRARIKTLEINGKYGFLFTNGITYPFLYKFYQNKTNALGSVWLILRIFFSFFLFRPYYRKFIYSQVYRLFPKDSASFTHDSSAVLCSTVKRMPLGPLLFPDLNESSKNFQCVSVAQEEIWFTPFRPSKPNRGKISLCCEELTIESKGSMNYSLDGELYPWKEKKLTIKQGPELEFIVV